MNGAFLPLWKKLSATERDVATAMSIIYEERSVLDLSRLLNKIGMAPPAGESRFTHAETEAIVHRLHETDMLVKASDHGWRINPRYSEAIMRRAGRRPDFSMLLNEIRRELPYKTYWQPSSPHALMREIRMAFYLQNEAGFDRLQRETESFYPDQARTGIFIDPLFAEFDPRWVESLLPAWQEINLRKAFHRALVKMEPLDPLVEFLEQHERIREPESGPMRELLAEAFVLQGAWSRLQLWADLETSEWRSSANHVIYHVLRDDDEGAHELIEEVRKGYRRENENKFPAHLAGYLYLVSLLRTGGVKSAEIMGYHLDNIDPVQNLRLGGTYLVFKALHAYLRNDETAQEVARQGLERMEANVFAVTFHALYRLWTDSEEHPGAEYLSELEQLRERAQDSGYRWVEMELTRILSHRHPEESAREAYGNRAQQLTAELRIFSLVDAMPRIEPWERALEVLVGMGTPDRVNGKRNKKTSRFVWFVDFEQRELEPREQTLSKGGSWSKGRKVALKRVKQGDVSGMTPQDVTVAQAIEEDYSRYHPNGSYTINYEQALLALVGHPNLYLSKNSAIGVELVRRNPQLLIEETDNRLHLRFAQDFAGTGVQVVKETPTRYQVIEVNDGHNQIHRQIGPGLEIPKRARHRLLEVARNLSKFTEVQNTLTGVIDDIDETSADSRTYVHLLPVGETFKVEFFVRPIRSEDQYFKPGRGRNKVISEVDGNRLLAERDLSKEIERAENVIVDCPTLQKIVHRDYEWQIDEVEDCLNILLELQPLRALDRIVLEHPRGERIKLIGSVDFGDLSLDVREKAGWFDVEGSLAVDEQQVISFRELIDKVAENEQSNFIQLSDGQYVALTEQLRRKLREMEGLMSARGEDGLQLHPLAGGMLDDIADQLGAFEADVAWRESLNRIQTVNQTMARVPSTFRAELRPYQLDGFRWLMRLADWGVGACLADDMGLGKTVQGLAMLQARAERGPALVIAPASVTRNWIREAAKFAPTLNPILLEGSERQRIIDETGDYDMLVVSYGLLPFEGEALAAKQFGTIILDEAQAIKNRGTKRSQIAMKLQGEFRVATTGTPIENHLGELWNLFTFLNPGLLGNFQRFNEKYTIPITRNNDNERRQQLRRLIQPFILRRRKEEVLEELPPKTEVTLTVELSPAERAFYEALRQHALEAIDEGEGPNRRFQILAELMKLRQAACHPRLVDPTVEIASSKLELLGETVRELRENGHKALIFSQFVRHLRIVEQWMIDHDVPYQYLDGSTPGPKRDAAVQAFQRGEGDIFLISLKAGGTGLTLTAADYVLHLDPWWNPAVEDQASDRAHRIGQQRPVTVYRFVSENTIEEKIVKLHAEKRDLADSLLAGTEQSGSLSADDLLDLIKNG